MSIFQKHITMCTYASLYSWNTLSWNWILYIWLFFRIHLVTTLLTAEFWSHDYVKTNLFLDYSFKIITLNQNCLILIEQLSAFKYMTAWNLNCNETQHYYHLKPTINQSFQFTYILLNRMTIWYFGKFNKITLYIMRICRILPNIKQFSTIWSHGPPT